MDALEKLQRDVARHYVKVLADRFAEGLRYVYNDPAANQGTVKKCIDEFVSAARILDETYDGTTFRQDATEAFSTKRMSDNAIEFLKEKLSE